MTGHIFPFLFVFAFFPGQGRGAGETMMLSPVGYSPESYTLSWRMTINGISRSVDGTIVNDFVGNVYPNLLAEQDKIPILHTILRSLYRQNH